MQKMKCCWQRELRGAHLNCLFAHREKEESWCGLFGIAYIGTSSLIIYSLPKTCKRAPDPCAGNGGGAKRLGHGTASQSGKVAGTNERPGGGRRTRHRIFWYPGAKQQARRAAILRFSADLAKQESHRDEEDQA